MNNANVAYTNFVDTLTEDGFEQLITVTRDAPGFDEAGATVDVLGEHRHAFEAKALVLEGEIRIVTASWDRTCRAGDIFHLTANELHNEYYGPHGVRYLVGRKL